LVNAAIGSAGLVSSGWIPEALLRAVAANAIGHRAALQDIQRDAGHPVRHAFELALAAVPAVDLEALVTDPKWSRTPRSADRDERAARGEILTRAVGDVLYSRRAAALCQSAGRPPPYDHPALTDVAFDNDHLVPLDTFTPSFSGLSRQGFVFALAIPLRSENSSDPSLQALRGLTSRCCIRVRPDPLMIAPEAGYRSLLQKMQVFGRGLDWTRIAELKDEECARWLPDELTGTDTHYTDLVWRRRGDEVHFECEEIPAQADWRPARYFHAIYLPAQTSFCHADAAVRFYTAAELASRQQRHLKDIDKVGTRVKLFRVDGDLHRQDFATLLTSAFVWNNDLRRYASMERDFDVERSSVRSSPIE
jgi:hypothetical protein